MLSGAPTDAGDYTLTVSIPNSNKYYTGSQVVSFSIAKKTVTIAAPDQAILAGQPFQSMMPVYSGFVAGDNVNGAAVAVQAVIAPAANSDLSKAGSAVLQVADIGTLTELAAKNYEFGPTVDGKLTILKAAVDTEKSGESPDGTGSSYKPDANSGIIQTAVIKEPGLPPATLKTDLNEAVAEKLLSSAELQEVKTGADALVYLVLSDADAAKDAAAEQAIGQKALTLNGGMKIGMYFDLSMFKRVGEDAPVQISESGTKVAVGLTVPEDLKLADDTMTRTYTVLYMHDGVVSEIAPIYKDGILLFDADRFSTYSIAYVDTLKPTDNGNATPTASPAPVAPANGADDTAAAEAENPAAVKTKKKTKKTDEPTVQEATATPTPAVQPETDNAGGQQQLPDTVKLQPTDKVEKEKELQLRDAVTKLGKLDPQIHQSFYVQVPDTADGGSGRNVVITIDIPENLRAKGRSFYLVGVDADGKVVVLQNQSTEDGVFSAAAPAGTVWQMVYEDNGAEFSDYVAKDGTIPTTGTDVLHVSTNHCLWHWVVLLAALCGVVLEWLLRKKHKLARVLLAADVAVMVLAAILGWCRWDVPALLLGLALAAGGYILGQKQNKKEST